MSESIQIAMAWTGFLGALLTPISLAIVAWINNQTRLSNERAAISADRVASTNQELVECAKLRDATMQRAAADARAAAADVAVKVEAVRVAAVETASHVVEVAKALKVNGYADKPTGDGSIIVKQ